MKPVIMKSTLSHLSLLYLWPKSEKSTVKSSYLFLLSGSFLLINSLLRLIISTRKKENMNIVENVETAISQFGVMYFAAFFVMNRKNVINIISDLSDLTTFGKPPHFDFRNKEIDKVGRFFAFLMFMAISTVSLWPVLYTKPCEESGEKVCGLVSPVWLPFDYSHFPIKQLVLIWQCHCCVVTYGGAMTLSVFMLETMEHLIIRIQHLKFLIEKVVEEPNPIVKQRLLAEWVEYHLYIFRIGKEMNKSFRGSLSVHILVAGALFGIIGHTLTKDVTTIDSIGLFSGWFASLFVVCLGGQRLLEESTSVGMAVYNTRWYEQEVKFQKNIFSILVRSQKPIVLHAGPFSNLTLLLILAVLRTAYSYVNLLNAAS